MSNAKIESPSEKQNRLFRQFIQGKRVLIVDSQVYSRAALTQALIDLGALSTSIALARTLQEAQMSIVDQFPDIVIAEYDLDEGQCGLELLQTQRNSNDDAKKSLFLLVTGNTSQAAVARAAEEDVDGYILKPYTMEGLRSALMRYAVLKAYPSDYVRTIEEGKKLLEEKQVDGALEKFKKASAMDPKPSLAYFYHGQAECVKKTLSNAESDYAKGLSYNKIHYKCLVGMFDLFHEQKRNKEAYDVVRKISHYFPANPDRLATVLRLAVMNEAYEDIERYYQLFCKLDRRNEMLIRYVLAALIVCGKYYLHKRVPSRAIELFNKAKATGARNPKLLREIIVSLLEYDLAVEAEDFLRAYPPELRGSHNYLGLEFSVYERKNGLGAALSRGRELLGQGVLDPLLYHSMIERSVQAKFQDAAESLHRKACELWPQQKEAFDQALTKPARRLT